MAKIVKETEVRTTVKKRVANSESISEEFYESLKERIIKDIQSQEQALHDKRRRRNSKTTLTI